MQTLVYLGSLMRAETIYNAIIVCPKSLVRTWEREANLLFKDIAPKCRVCVIDSDVAKGRRMEMFTEAFCSSFKKPSLVVTTYGLIDSHITELHKIASQYPEWCWNYCILDEGHCIKNPNTIKSRNLRILCHNKKTRRLLLTGTPIQNNLKELHSLFDWATSGQLLGTSKTFLNKYATPIEEGRQKNASAWEVKKAAEMNKSLQQLLQPYFLQRLKSSEFQDKLPTKKELVVFVALSKKQRSLYQQFLDGGMVRSVLSGETASPLTAISYLKQLCGHPSLIRDDRDAIVDNRPSHILLEESAKLQVLFSLMKRLKRAGHRALVFSQSTKMLDIIERVFDGTFAFLRIDGQTEGKTRQRYVDDFNDKDSGIDCMLLSTKAAGVGLTLNGANRAIIYDPSWNPAEDCQAVDRCYRIGQSKNVTVYRMIVSGTVEEKMYEKQGERHTALFSSATYVVTNIQRDTRIAVHKDGIKRVLLMESAGATKRYFDKADLSDLFKLAPADAPCSMLEKFHDKEKQSFLSKDPNVIGVASHDVLYDNAVGNGSNDNNAVDLTSSSKTPFSREPFKNSAPITSPSIADAPIANVEIVEVDEPQNLMPLGRGLNRTREHRVNAKARRNDEVKETAKSNESSTVDDALSIATHHMSNNEYANAIDVLLELLENRSNAIQSDAKLKVHENIAFAASKLGWL
ncbi:hypothetical protein ACHAWO_009293 [Cyclotella atomus]|uniref:Uncharacterized protein n=1 Tax=Cyclotella atomus TaxID=382360 RepID=A0ABD3MTC1_9STRA